MGDLADRMKLKLELLGRSRHTVSAYLRYARMFVRFHMRSPEEMGEAEVQAWMQHLIVEKQAKAELLIGPMPEAWLTGLDAASAHRQLGLLREPLRSGEVRTATEHLEEADELIVVVPDRPGLFAAVCGVLSLRGIDVHDADIYTRADGAAIEIFRVRGTHGAVPDDRWEQVRRDIAAVLAGHLDLDEALGRKAAQTRRRRSAHRRPVTAQVVVDNGASETHTVVEVHAEDRLGLLRLITKALTDAGCDLSFAKIATHGIDVVDVFYVHDLEGHRITAEEHVRRIEDTLHHALQTERSRADG